MDKMRVARRDISAEFLKDYLRELSDEMDESMDGQNWLTTIFMRCKQIDSTLRHIRERLEIRGEIQARTDAHPGVTKEAEKIARSFGVDWRQLEGSGRNGKVRVVDVRRAAGLEDENDGSPEVSES